MNGALFFVTFWSIFLMLQLFRVDNANEYLLYCRQLAMTNCLKVKMNRLGISRPFSGKRSNGVQGATSSIKKQVV